MERVISQSPPIPDRERGRVVAESAGACSLEAALSGRAGSGKVVCVVSGGNIDLNVDGSVLAGRRTA